MTDTNHDEVTNRFGGMFNDFLTAAKAMEALPKLEAMVRDAEAQRDYANGEKAHHMERADNLAQENAILKDRIAQLEANLDAASKSEGRTADNLKLLLETIRHSLGDVSAAVELADPQAPDPAPQPTEQPIPLGDPQPSSSEPQASSTSSIPEPGTFTNPSGDKTSPFNPSADASPADQSPPVGSPSADATAIASSNDGRQQGQSDENPTVSTMGDTSQPAPASGPTASTEQSPVPKPVDASQPKPRPYWEKPTTETWDQWAAHGNETPSWYIPRS